MDRNALVDSAFISFRVESDREDLLDDDLTQDHLIAMLAIMVTQGIPFEVTSVRTDHGSDANLGPHGHSHGYAVDVVLNDDSQAPTFLQNAATHNRFVTKIGLGGTYQQYADAFGHGATLVFNDNDQDHIHLQTA